LKKSIISLIALVITNLLIISCSKESDMIGLEIQPPSDRLNAFFTDSASVFAYTQLDDSIRTDNLSLNVVGYLNDRLMGKTQAGVAFEIIPSSRNVKFGEEVVVDSAFLTIAYKGFYGDSTLGVSLGLYELNEKIFIDSSYYSNHKFKLINKNLISGSSTFYHKPSTIEVVDNVAILPNIKIPINKNWIKNKIISKSGEPELSDDVSFKEYFNGLYLIANSSTNGGNMAMLDLKSSHSKLEIHYKNSEKDSLSYNFVVSDKCSRTNTFDHLNFSDASLQFQQQVLNNDISLGKELLYLKSMGGTKVYLKFPNVKEMFAGQRVIINKAELVMSTYGDAFSKYYAAENITANKVREDSTYQFLPDDAVHMGELYFGGNFDRNKNEYRIRLTKYIQNLIDSDDEDYGITLFVNGRAVKTGSIALIGTNPTTRPFEKRLKLEITYSLLN
jgi:hypothetical protein